MSVLLTSPRYPSNVKPVWIVDFEIFFYDSSLIFALSTDGGE